MSNSTHLRLALIAALAGSVAACSGTTAVTSPIAAPISTSTAARDVGLVQRLAAEGQLFCAEGPAVLEMFNPSGAAILAKGATKAAVDATCAIVGGVAVALSDVSVTPQGVQVTLPSSITIPTKPVS